MTAPLTQTTGRRKRSVARARLRPGTGTITIKVSCWGVSSNILVCALAPYTLLMSLKTKLFV